MQQVAERIRARKAAGAGITEPANVYEWAMRYRRLEGQRFSLDRFPPLKALYADDFRRIVVMKPAQRGVSEWAVNLTCFALEHGHKYWAPPNTKDGLNVGYIFPVKKALEDFAKERINGLREESTHLATLFAEEDFDSLGYKKVGRSQLYMRGAYATSDLLSFPADMIILDEYDQMEQKAVSLAIRRMGSSLVKREVRISTPTIPGRGISAAFESSDKRVYQTQCPECEEWNTYDFFRDIRVDNEPYDVWKQWTQDHAALSEVTLHCPECDAVIDEAGRLGPGRWLITQPDMARTHGYHIPWWPFPSVELEQFVFASLSPEPSEVEEFYRSDLGMPYGAGAGAITEEVLAALTAEWPEDIRDVRWKNTTMGVDIGARLHFRVASEDQQGNVCVREMGSVDEWSDLDKLMLRYQIRLALVDAEPELHDAIDFCKRFRGRAKRAFYPTNAGALKGILLHEKKDTFDVQINRTMAMDRVYGNLTLARERWPKEIAFDPEVIDHMKAPTRVKISDATGQQHYTWIHTTPDHLYHACVYDTVARELLPKASSHAPAVGGERQQLQEVLRHAIR